MSDARKMLIIDDELGIVEEIRSFFSEEGFDVRTADSGTDGLRLIGEIQPDIVILDIKLPDMSGLDILRQSKEAYPIIKIIVNTGYVDQSIIDESERLGRDAFLQKPFNLELLYDEVNRLIEE